MKTQIYINTSKRGWDFDFICKICKNNLFVDIMKNEIKAETVYLS